MNETSLPLALVLGDFCPSQWSTKTARPTVGLELPTLSDGRAGEVKTLHRLCQARSKPKESPFACLAFSFFLAVESIRLCCVEGTLSPMPHQSPPSGHWSS